MRDSSIGRLFSKVTVEPDSAFISALERRLRSELVAPMSFDHRTESVSIGEELSDGDALTIDLDGYAGPSLAVGPRVDHRRRRVSAMLLATAAAVIVTAVVIVSTASEHHVITSVPTTIGKPATSDPATTTSEPTPSTTTPQTIPIAQPAGFVQDLATDLTTADGSTFHVDATVTFKVAIESNESSEQANHDVLLLPKVVGAITNTGSTSAILGTASVQILMAGDFPCVTTGDTCDRSITIALPITIAVSNGDAPTGLAPGAVHEFDSAAGNSRVSVPAGDVPSVIDEVALGDKVVGVSVSVTDTTGQIVTKVFDRSGNEVLTCATLATECLGSDRSALGIDAAPVDTSATDEFAFPAGAAPPGTYSPKRFVVPYVITTGGPWQVVRDDGSATLLRRHDSTSAVALQIGDGSLLNATSPAQALASLCVVDGADSPIPRSTTLFGRPALEIDGVVTADCELQHILKYGDLVGDTYRAVAAEVGGRVVYVVGVGPEYDWATFVSELDATIASLTLR